MERKRQRVSAAQTANRPSWSDVRGTGRSSLPSPFRPGRRDRPRFLLLCATLFLITVPAGARQVSEWEWDEIPRLVVVGDVHGSFDKLLSILRGLDLVDESSNWTGSETHLVFCGDLIDRGPADRAVLDLVRKLQPLASASGGGVHVVLGNHEVMNLIRDVRYVSRESYAEFAKEESSDERDRGWQRFQASERGSGLGEAELREAFDVRYPPGYFAHAEAFRSGATYGSWLLEQPAVVKINGVLFLHGGLTEEVAELGLTRLNSEFQTSLRAAVSSIEALESSLDEPAEFQEVYRAAMQMADTSATGPAGVATAKVAARRLIQEYRNLPFTPAGPVWYRGNSLENERAERYVIDAVLQSLGAERMAVAHSPTKTGMITSRFNGRVFRTDVGMAYGGEPRALVIEGGRAAAFDAHSGTLSQVPAEPPQGEGRSHGADQVPDEQLERMLREGEVTARTPIVRVGRTGEIWELQADGVELRAVYKDVREKVKAGRDGVRARNSNHEVAAYLLDRKLGLGMVPVAVLRGSGRKAGVLRVIVESAIDAVSIKSYRDLSGKSEEEIVEIVSAEYGVEAAGLQVQVNAAWLFDALIDNLHREDFAVLFVPGDGRLALVNHEAAFGLETAVDASIAERCRGYEKRVETALKLLDRNELMSELGPYLTGSQIDALLARKDALLELCAP